MDPMESLIDESTAGVKHEFDDVAQIRRVVTGVDDSRRSVVIFDGGLTQQLGTTHGQIWTTEGAPANNRGSADAALDPMSLRAPPLGSRFWIMIVEAGAGVGEAQHREAARNIAAMDGHVDPDDLRMHTTHTVDYGVVLSGEITLILDDADVTLRPLDCFVQRGTSHHWENRTSEDAVMAVVLIDAAPTQNPA